jgi:hypothetical protein
MSAVVLTVASLPGLRFEARALCSPPPIGSLVFLYGSPRLVSVAWYRGDDTWEVVHERFPGVVPTHWAVPIGPGA